MNHLMSQVADINLTEYTSLINQLKLSYYMPSVLVPSVL